MKVRAGWYAFGNLGANIFSQAFATFILFFYIDHLHAPLGAITIAMTMQSVWHALLNPAIGQLSDRTHTALGRRIPYIAGLSLPLGIVFFLLWHPLVPHAWLAPYFLIMVLLFDLIYLAVVLNWTSLFPEMFPTLKERTQAQLPRQMVGVAALMIGVALPPVLYSRWGWTAMAAILAVVGTGGFLASLRGSRENPRSAAASPPWSLWEGLQLVRRFAGFRRFLAMNFLVQLTLGLVPAVLPFYAKYVVRVSPVGLSLLLASIFVTAFLVILPWTGYIRRHGSHRSLSWTIFWLMLGLTPFLWTHSLAVLFVAAVMLGVGLGGFLILADVLMAEVIDHDARASTLRREGIFYGINGFVLRLGVSVQAWLLYMTLHDTGFQANAAASATPLVQFGFRFLISLVPLVLLASAYLIMRHYDVPQSLGESSASLSETHS